MKQRISFFLFLAKRSVVLLVSGVFSVWLLSLPLHADEVRVTEIKPGFEGYYRPGYWCPIKFKLSSDDESFRGYLEVETGHLSYKKYFEIPPKSHKEISLSVLIYSVASEIKFSIYPSDDITRTYSNTIPIKAVEPKRFLIGVEKRLYRIFLSGFSRYTEAAQHSDFFAFLPEELTHNWQDLEAIDLLVISENTFDDSEASDTLELWQKGLKGNLFVMGGPRVDLRGIAKFHPHYHYNQAIVPDAYTIFERPRWFNYTKQSLYKFLALYFLFTLVIFIVSIWVRHKPRYYFIMIMALIGLNILCFLMIFITCVIPADFVAERLRFVTFDIKQKIIKTDEFFSINPLRDKVISIPVDNEFIKPIYPDINKLEKAFPVFITSEKTETHIASSGLTKRSSRFILKQKEIIKSESIFKIEHHILESKHQYRLVNETNSTLEDCFILTPKGCGYLGKVGKGEVKEFTIPEGSFMNWPIFLADYLTASGRTSRYQKQLLKMWYRKHFQLSGRKTNYLIGWNKKPIAKQVDYITVEYPELWVILLDE